MIFIPDMDVKLAVDPYFIWAEATDFRDYGKIKNDDWVSFVVECHDGETVQSFADRLKQSIDKNNPIWCKIPNFYLRNSARFKTIRFCTIQVQRKNILKLQKEVKRFELGMPVNPRSADSVLETTIHDQYIPVNNTLVVGIIDDFVGFAHNTFATAPDASTSATRVERVWSQSLKLPADKYWKKSKASNSYGFELDFSKIKSSKDLKLAYPDSLPNMTHGSHVASVAAGKKSYKNPNVAADLHQDAAASASIVAVHLPQSTLEDSSGGAMNAQLLDGIHYILANTKDDATVVINASYSTHAGAHDGTSILEEAMDELIRLSNRKLVIVLPVGNHYEARGHAKFDLPTNSVKNKHKQKMLWQVLPDCSSSSFMEIWLPRENASLLEIELTDPNGKSIVQAGIGENWVLGHEIKSPQFSIIFPGLPGSSTKNVMALLVISPTRQDATNIDVAQHGLWTVMVGLTEEARRTKELIVPVDAWIERNDTIKRAHRQRGQSYFVDAAYKKYAQKPGQTSDNPASYIKRFGSRNTIAGGLETIVVGGYQYQSMLAAAYSACLPDVAAMSDENKTLRGVRGAGARGLSVVRMNGTSVAAPVVARCIANYLSSNRSASKADLIAGLPSASKAASSARKQRVLIPERDGAKQVGA
jgi:Subtilase family